MLAIAISTYNCSTNSLTGTGFWKQYQQSNVLHSITLLSYLGGQLCIQTKCCVCKQRALYTNPHAGLSALPCNVGMAERDNVRESISLSLLQRQLCPQPHAHINSSLLFMGSFHKPVQLAHPTERVLIVLFWVSK